MAVDPDLVEAIAASVADIYREAETALIRLVARHLAAGLDSPTAERRLGGIRALRRGAQAIIAALEADSGPAIRDRLADAYRHGWTNAVADLPERLFPRSGIGQAARQAAEDSPGFGAVEALATALHRDFDDITRNVLRNVDDAFRSVQAAAAARILTGTQTRLQAAQAAWQRLVDRGLMSFTDRAGRRWRLSSYVEMAARTNAQRAAITAQVDRLNTLGVDLVYVSDSVQECRLCRPFEGRVLRTGAGATGRLELEHATADGPTVTVDVAATLAGATARGLFHPNCRHSISAYLPGVTRLPAQPTADPAGDEARQRQRELERRIRRAKEREAAALDEPARRASRAKVRAAQADLRDHLAQHPDLKRLRYREQIGAGNIPPRGRGDAAGDLGPPSEPSLDGGPAGPPPRRPRVDAAQARADKADSDRQPGPGQPELEPPDPRPTQDVRDLSDEELEQRLLAAMGDDFDEDEFTRVSVEIDRRQAEQQAREEARERNRQKARERRERQDVERAEQLRDLIDAGWDEEEAVAEVYGISIDRQRRDRAISDLREQGFTGRSFDELARASYRDYVYRSWLAAENATRGVLVTREGQAAGIEPRSLFHGPEARARRWASDELKAWWDEHGRLTFQEWKAMLTGDSTEARRLRETRGGDFLA